MTSDSLPTAALVATPRAFHTYGVEGHSHPIAIVSAGLEVSRSQKRTGLQGSPPRLGGRGSTLQIRLTAWSKTSEEGKDFHERHDVLF